MSGLALLLGAAIASLAALLGGVTGFGYALVATPLLMLCGFDLASIVAVNMTLGLLARLQALIVFRRSISFVRVKWMVIGSLPGIGVGLWIATVADESMLRRLLGLVIIAVALLLVVAPVIPRQPSAVVGFVGALGGLFGMVASLNGVPPALLYAAERQPAQKFIADLAGYFLITNTLVAVMAFASYPGSTHTLWMQVAVGAPGVMLATWIGTRWGGRLPVKLFRRAVFLVIFGGGFLATVFG